MPLLRAALPLLCAWVVGCATGNRPPPATAPAQAPHSTQQPLQTWLDAERARARAALVGGDPVAAREAWSAVLALEPGDTEARQGHRQAATTASEAAAALQRAAEAAHSRGDTEAALRAALRALALDPTLATPALLLRALEQQRAGAAHKAAARNAAAPWPEEAGLLLAEGDVSGALRLAEPLARAARADAPIRHRVCELLLREAERLGRDDAAAAREHLQRCLQLLPRHGLAQQRLQQPR